MSSVIKLMLCIVLGSAPLLALTSELRVCADPNNLPYSNQQQQGFENALAVLAAKHLGRKLSYVWFPQRHRFFEETLAAGKCDVVMEVPAHANFAATTIPYYRSVYVFISRRDRGLHIRSFDDPRLKELRIGVHITGDADGNLPPTTALLHRGLVRNIAGYSIFGRLSDKNPAQNLIEAVLNRDVDLAVAWGPLAGYFAEGAQTPLDVEPVCAGPSDANIPFSFAISMGVRRGDEELLRQLNDFIATEGRQIRKILKSYAVPLVDATEVHCQ